MTQIQAEGYPNTVFNLEITNSNDNESEPSFIDPIEKEVKPAESPPPLKKPATPFEGKR